MSFMDSLSKFAKDLGEGAVNVAKKSGEAVEITKLNLAIKTEEEDIDNVCMEIGRIIYSKYKNKESVDLDILESCKKIDGINRNIDVLKQKVLEIKNIKICKSCSSEINIDIEFCPKCGSRQKTVKKRNIQRICSECNNEVYGAEEYCPKCGNRIKR